MSLFYKIRMLVGGICMSKSLVGNFFIKVQGTYKEYKGYKAFYAGKYIKAKNAFQELYDLYKCELGEKHPDTLDALEALAISYECLGNYNKALELSEEGNSRRESSRYIICSKQFNNLIF